MQSTFKSSVITWLIIPCLRLVNRLLSLIVPKPNPSLALPPARLLTPEEQDLLETAERSLIVSTSENSPVGQSYETSDISRTNLVMALLDEAYAQGISTYPLLIQYVTDKTGQGCSRRAIARWKRERNLL